MLVHVHHAEGPRLRAGRERRGRPLPRHRRPRPRDRAPAHGGRPDVGRRRSRDEIAEIGDERERRRRRHRGHAASRSGCTGSRNGTPTGSFDVGIAEQHAVTSARPAWRYAGLHPVVAVYATFLNRAVRPGDHGRRRCTGPASPSPSTHGGCHRRRRPQPQRHVGPLAPRRRARHPDRGPARRRDAPRRAPRGGRGRGRADRRPLPQGRRCRPTCPPSTGSAALDVLRAPRRGGRARRGRRRHGRAGRRASPSGSPRRASA